MEVIPVRYTMRLRPGKKAETYLNREFGMCRYVWNSLVEASQTIHRTNQHETLLLGVPLTQLPTFGYAEQDRYLTHLRATTIDPTTGHQWLAAGSSVAQQQTVRDFAQARTQALKDRANPTLPAHARRGLPRYKSRRHTRPTLNYTTRGFSLHPVNGTLRLKLPGGILIPVVWSRPLPNPPTSVRVYQDSLGHWYASFVVPTPTPTPTPPVTPGRAVGIDWGLTTIAATATINLDTGETDTTSRFDLPHPHHHQHAHHQLARHQKAMARRKPKPGHTPSKGYATARRKAAQAHKKIARQRHDDAHKWAHTIVAHHTHIAVEDFKPAWLTQNRALAATTADAAIATTKTVLLWHATKTGRTVCLIHPAHTTTTCSNCHARTKRRLPLEQRTYKCTTCGLHLDRDKNAALVIINRAGFNPADADGIRPGTAAQRNQAS